MCKSAARKKIVLPILWCVTWAAGQDTAWVDLFNGMDFEGWYCYKSGGHIYENPLDDPDDTFTVTDGIISHIARGPQGMILTDSLYSRYHFRVEYKFGNGCTLSNYCKNSGLMYCMIQEGIWGRGIESNMYWDWPAAIANLGGVQFDDVRPDFGNFSSGADVMNQYTTDGEWNLMEVIVWGDSAVEQYVNGHLGGWAVGIRQPGGEPLTEGRIGLQAEGNDVMFRSVQIRDLDASITLVGCMDTSALNYNPGATAPCDTCCEYTEGCTDPAAVNYDSTAAVSCDTCCEYVSVGHADRDPGPMVMANRATGLEIVITSPGDHSVCLYTPGGTLTEARKGKGARTYRFAELPAPGVYLVRVKIDGRSTAYTAIMF